MVTNITKITENLGSSLVWGNFFIYFFKSLSYKDSLLKKIMEMRLMDHSEIAKM
jgi:hypothetical protein